MRSRGIVVVLLALAAVAGCAGARSDSMVDGWSIGERAPCTPDDARCGSMVEVATERLAGRDPFHSPIVEVTVHAEGMYPNRDGELGPLFRSGGFPTIVRFRLADGSFRAIGVRFEFNNELPTAYDRGPERRPGRGADGTPAPTT